MSLLDPCRGDECDVDHAGRRSSPPVARPVTAFGHSRFHPGLLIAGVVMWKLHVENPLHEEDGIGVEIQLGARLPHHRVVGMWVQEDGDVPAAHQHLGSWPDRMRSLAMPTAAPGGQGLTPRQVLAPPCTEWTMFSHLPLTTTPRGEDHHSPIYS